MLMMTEHPNERGRHAEIIGIASSKVLTTVTEVNNNVIGSSKGLRIMSKMLRCFSKSKVS